MQFFKTAALLSGLALMAALTGCGNKSENSDRKVEVDSFAFNQVLKSASRNYQIILDDETPAYLSISARIAWPEKLGHADISQLQDSLASYTFGDSIYATPDDAVIHFIEGIKELKDFFGAVKEVNIVDSIPMDVPAFILRTDADMIDISDEYVSYAVTNSQYLGGAHGEVAQLPFTYDLTRGKVMTKADYFLPGHEKEIVDVIKQSLIYQMGTTPEQLASMGIFQYDNAGVGNPYIKGATLFVHYNPYDIAPYAAGQFDIPVSSVLISPYLTPEAKELIGYDY